MPITTPNSIGAAIIENLRLLGFYLGFESSNPLLAFASLIRTAMGFLGIIFVAIIIWAGFLWMISGGKEEQVKKAKSTFFNAVIGLIIIISAYSIVNFILGALLSAP